ncbi:4'-phosphopantetheinyl transferase superfamily protein [Arthrobacter sp. UYCu712]|uniref:4'-phosphopantetheinyl transferase family protein n=1 Tax=Arthrobacter sp. UYCu712 TaxID=3156340 RepID=UPI003399663B
MQPLTVLRSCPSVHRSGWTEGQERDARELLDAVERERADAMLPGPRAVFLSGRLAQRRFAAELSDEPAAALTVDYACPRCGQGAGVSHGRPGYTLRGSALPLSLSLARAPGWILLAAVIDPAPGLRIGVDVEDPARMDFAGFDSVALTPAEHQGLGGLPGPELLRGRARFWARKEAWLKMTGEGLRTPPDTLDVLHRAGIRDLTPAETGLPGNLAAAVAVSLSG